MPDREKVIAALEKACRDSVELPPFAGHIVITKEALEEGILPLLREQERTGWVSVTERLPEEKGEYIVFDGETVFGAYYEINAFGTTWTDPTEGYYEYRVTHWRPMPEPPEGVGGK